ncbi:MAG: hypothetical protein WBF17_11185 [Phycisphaerae bacterium]
MSSVPPESGGGGDGAREGCGQGCCAAAGWLLGLLGAAVGGFLGYWLFFVIARQGFYGIVLPGALIGIGCGCLSGRKSNALGFICGAAGLLAGLLAEWRFAPFVADKSLWYFLTHLHRLRVVTQVLIALGAALAFWFGRGREGGALPWRRKPPAEERRETS